MSLQWIAETLSIGNMEPCSYHRPPEKNEPLTVNTKDPSTLTMRLLIPIVFALPLGFFASCMNPEKNISDPTQKHALIEDYYVNSAERARLTALANQGDAQAALKLGQFFTFFANDCETGKYWYKKAADNGGVEEKEIYRSFIQASKELDEENKQFRKKGVR